MAEYSDARSRGGGRSFRSAPRQKAPVTKKQQPAGQQKPGMSRGLMGGLLGGALGGMLLGSMFGMGGSGMGILPLLLLGVVGYFLYKRFSARPPVVLLQATNHLPRIITSLKGTLAATIPEHRVALLLPRTTC